MKSSLSLSSGSNVGAVVPRSDRTPAVLSVDNVTVQGPGTGVHHGDLVNFTVNQYIVPHSAELDVNAQAVNELLTDIIKINTDNTRQFFKQGTRGPRDWWRCAVEFFTKYVPKRYRKLTVLFLVTSIVTVVGSVLFSLFGLHSSSSADGVTNSSLVIVTREEWGAQNSTGEFDNNTLPILSVIVGHTAESSCALTANCITIVQRLQKVEQEQGFSDITYNFLIGGDGKAYEGRGWLLEGAHTKNNNARSLGVAFIGTYTTVEPGVAMVQAFTELVNLSLALSYLSVDYDLLGQCQLKDTLSPGRALILDMTTWPHFDNQLSFNNCYG